MDFIDLATAAQPTQTLLRRALTSAAAAAAAATVNEDDDFTNLAPPGEHEASVAAAEAAADYQTGGLYGEAPGRPANTMNFDPYSSDANAPNGGDSSPLLSPSAEAELYLLATNFLLYVAMVIITTMVCKIYFPESLERAAAATTAAGGGGGGGNARSVSFVRKNGSGGLLGNDGSYYSSDASDDEDDEEAETGVGSEEEEGESSGSSGGSGGDGDDDGDSDGDSSDDERETEGLLEMEGPDGSSSSGSPSRKRGKKKRGYNSQGSSSFLLEFDQSTTARSDVMKRLMFCVLMLNVTFVAWGVLQERMLTRRYPRITGEYFTYSYALVFTNRFWTLIMSGALLLYLKPRRSHSTVIYEYSFPSISNLLSSWCQYEALQYVSFPATTLFKSFKLAPVMAMGKILGNREYPQYDYAVALVIGVGITMFMSASDDLHFGYDIHGEQASATWTGIMLLCFFLFFDSFTSQWQSRMFQRHRDLSMVELMFATSAFSTVLSFITLVHTNELGPALSFVYRHSEIHLHFFMFSICSTIGQLFIYYTIKNFGAVVFTIIMTTRILLSIALSCILYGHDVGSTGFLGLVVVMGAVCYRIKRKAEGKQLVKWQGMGDEKAMELVQEWHEHADM